MRTTKRDLDDNVLKDGRLIVPMRLMDSARPRVGETYDDYTRRVAAADSQPGFVARDAATHARLDDCYETYNSEISTAWNKPTHTATRDDAKACQDCGRANALDASFCDNCGAEFGDDGVDAVVSETTTHNYDNTAEPLTGIGSHGTRGQQEGAVCTINGRAGHLRSVNGTLQCVPDRAAKTAPPARRGEVYDPAVGAIRPHGAGMDASATKDAAYSSYNSALRDAWRAK